MYLDTAILVKLLVREGDSEFSGALTDAQVISSSIIPHTEVWSAPLGKERAGALSADQRRAAWSAFEQHLADDTIWLAPLNEAVANCARRILNLCHPRVPLRSLDALHLAACDQLQDWPLCTADRRMRDAAALLKFPIIPKNDGT